MKKLKYLLFILLISVLCNYASPNTVVALSFDSHNKGFVSGSSGPDFSNIDPQMLIRGNAGIDPKMLIPGKVGIDPGFIFKFMSK
jgi:hypothetical protein